MRDVEAGRGKIYMVGERRRDRFMRDVCLMSVKRS